MQDEIVRSFQFCLKQRAPIDEPLQLLLDATGARATALWRRVNDSLHLIGFRGVPDMPTEVREGFAAAVRNLPLTETRLGCVKAAVTGEPVVAVQEEQPHGLIASASWLTKFGSRQSLAIPVFSTETNDVIGVIAISTPEELVPSDDAWRLLEHVARELRTMMNAAVS